jgi:methyl-accepting chemotaxis protein/cytochrome b561
MTYPRPLRLIHWSIAILVTCQLAIAVVLTHLHSLSYGQWVLSVHRQLGLAILLLVVARLVMSRWHKAPPSDLSSLPRWQVGTAAVVHAAFIVLLILQAVIGVCIAWGRGDVVSLLGLVNLPAPLEISESLREGLMTVHAVTAVSLSGLCSIHIGAVLFNRVVRRASVLNRMLPPVFQDKLVNKVPVSVQLALAFALMIGAAFSVGVSAVKTYQAMGNANSAFQDQDIAVAEQLRLAQAACKDLAVALATGDATTDIAHLKELAHSVRTRLEDAQAHAPPGEFRSGLSAVTRQAAELTTGAGVASSVALKALDEKLQEFIDAQSMLTLQHRTENDDLAAQGHDLIVVTMLPMVLAALITAILLAHSFTGSLASMAALVQSIEADRRDGAMQVEGSAEFAGLARSIISMRAAIEMRSQGAAARQAELEAERARLAHAQLQHEAALERQQRIARQSQREQLASQFELQIVGIIGTVGEAAQALTSTAHTMAASAAASTQRSRDASSVAVNTSEGASQVAVGTTELSNKAQLVRENAEKSKAKAELAVQEAGQVNEQIGHLAAAVRQISSITDLISAVARQTNLLAINARVEAARAGETGRGFSVVADEVKALAQRTGQATNDIEQQIARMNVAASSSLESLERLLEVIAGVDQAASAIFAVADAQGASTRQIAKQVSEISSATRAVAEDIWNAQETAGTTEQMSADVVTAAALIQDQASCLLQQVGHFVQELRNSDGRARPQSVATPLDTRVVSANHDTRLAANGFG